MSTGLTETILRLADSLDDCAQKGNWPALAQLDSDVATLLRGIQPAPAPLEPALKRLRASHKQAMSLAGQHAELLQRKLQTLDSHSEGLRAYAQAEQAV